MALFRYKAVNAHGAFSEGQVDAADTRAVVFRLQSMAGPVVLSQIGYVAAVVGVGLMAPMIGEQRPAILWLSIGLIVLG